MKLLLTSAGITNQQIATSLLKLLDKPIGQTSLLYINTAANPEEDKSYQIKDLNLLNKLGFSEITEFDISKNNLDAIKVEINKNDVIWFGGGNTFYLLDQLRKTGLFDQLKNLLDNKIYGGVSAGSIIATPSINVAFVEPADTNGVGITDLTGLCLVNFEISPHCPDMVSLENTQSYANKISNILYSLDDQSAISIDGETIKIISQGGCEKFN